MADKEHTEEIIGNLSKILNVDRVTLARAITNLLSDRGDDPKEELAKRAGLRISNLSDTSILIRQFSEKPIELQQRGTQLIVPIQFELSGRVPNAPYNALGILPAAFLHVEIHANEGPCKVLIDWENTYANAGLWGNIRFVVEYELEGRLRTGPLKHLKAEVKSDSTISLFGMGIGMDIFSDAFAQFSQQPAQEP